MLNRVILIGNLGADPEVRVTPGGLTITSIRLATSRKWKDRQSGEKKEETEWHRVVFFNRLAETVRDYVKKGQQLYVEGRIQTQKWKAQDGTDRYTTEIVAEEMHMLGNKNGSTKDLTGEQVSQYESSYSATSNESINEEWLDDIPFPF